MTAESQRILMLTPYAPYRDGIAAYAVQEVRALRDAGHHVEVLSPVPSAAHHHLSLGNAAGIARLLRVVGGFDRVIIQFSPEMIFARIAASVERLAVWGLLLQIVKRCPTELRIHEIQCDPMRNHASERRLAAAVLKGAALVTVHTEPEREDLLDAAGVDPAVIQLVEHGRDFDRHSFLSQAQARAKLGLDPAEVVFLSIGFVQREKGFDRGVLAFRQANLRRASMHVVGETRLDDPEVQAYAAELARLVGETPRAFFHRRFVGDSEFDDWIIASDCVVLPYRKIWSSSVVERSKLLDRPVIASEVGGLPGQHAGGLVAVASDDQLTEEIVHFYERSNPNSAMEGTAMTEVDQPDGPSLADVQARIQAAGMAAGGGTLNQGDEAPAAGSATEPLDRLQPLVKPAATSHRRGIGQAKAVVDKLTHFQMVPIVEHINRLHRVVRTSTKTLEDRIRVLEERLDQLE